MYVAMLFFVDLSKRYAITVTDLKNVSFGSSTEERVDAPAMEYMKLEGNCRSNDQTT
jgi:hypothetical protein